MYKHNTNSIIILMSKNEISFLSNAVQFDGVFFVLKRRVKNDCPEL